jgi:hypothetical protein
MSQKTISARKLAANQANAKKSSGPRTAAGKQRSSENSFKHGLYSAETVVPKEDPHLYHAFSVEWYRLYPPRDFEELSILSDMIATRWRFLRQCGIDTKIWEEKLRTQDRLRANGNSRQPDAADPVACLAYAFFPNSALIESNRQIKSLMRAWLGLLDRLKKLHQRPDTEILVPLPEASRQPPPPPSVTPRTPPAQATENRRTNPPQTEPEAAPKGETEANTTPSNAPPRQD